MPETKAESHLFDETAKAAYRQGRQQGLAVAALTMSLVAFVSLLGLEKAILAGIMGVVALRGAPLGSSARKLGVTAVVIVCVYIATFGVLLVLFHEKFAQLFRLLQQLG